MLALNTLLKQCLTCKIDKSIDCFSKNIRQNNNLDPRCKSCEYERLKEYRKTPEGKRSRFKDRLKRNFGLSVDEYNQLFAEQDGRCKICLNHQTNLSNALSVDHDHITGTIRGLLCIRCNVGLGNFEDSVEFLELAIEYLNPAKHTRFKVIAGGK